MLDLRPLETFREQTKYLDEALHVDARHETIGPPLLGSKVRQDMLRSFLAPGPGDRILDLGCGSGRTLAWNAGSGALLVGIDIAPFFAREARAGSHLILGDLRRMPLRPGVFNKAWSLDVLEHLSLDALRGMLAEAHRVLADGGALFVYTHVRKNGWPAAGVRAANWLARGLERVGLLDLRLERLRKSDHVNPLDDHDQLTRVARDAGFEIERITYYTPVAGAFVENVLVRLGERWLGRRQLAHSSLGEGGPAATVGTTADANEAALRAGRQAAKQKVRQGGATYRALVALSTFMKIDLLLFGRVKSGPFFALLRKTAPGSRLEARGSRHAAGQRQD